MSPSTDTPVDPARCPLCGQFNQCANEIERLTGVAQEPCWCTTAQFSSDLLAKVPAHARRKACVCASCAASSLHQRDGDGAPPGSM